MIMIEKHGMHIKNYKSVESIEEDRIIIFEEYGKLIIRGSDLEVRYFSAIEIVVLGQVSRIEII